MASVNLDDEIEITVELSTSTDIGEIGDYEKHNEKIRRGVKRSIDELKENDFSTLQKCVKCKQETDSFIPVACSHVFCSYCYKQLFADLQADSDARCPEDGNIVLPNFDAFENLSVGGRQVVPKMKVSCRNKDRGCEKMDFYEEMRGHLKKCVFRLMSCPYECPEQVVFKDLTEHLTNSCDCRLVKCNFCNDSVALNKKQEHEKNCPSRPVSCTYCKMENILLKMLANHIESCPMSPSICIMRNIGCTYEGTRKDTVEHQQSWPDSHLEVFVKSIESLQSQLNELASRFDALTQNQVSTSSQAEPQDLVQDFNDTLIYETSDDVNDDSVRTRARETESPMLDQLRGTENMEDNSNEQNYIRKDKNSPSSCEDDSGDIGEGKLVIDLESSSTVEMDMNNLSAITEELLEDISSEESESLNKSLENLVDYSLLLDRCEKPKESEMMSIKLLPTSPVKKNEATTSKSGTESEIIPKVIENRVGSSRTMTTHLSECSLNTTCFTKEHVMNSSMGEELFHLSEIDEEASTSQQKPVNVPIVGSSTKSSVCAHSRKAKSRPPKDRSDSRKSYKTRVSCRNAASSSPESEGTRRNLSKKNKNSEGNSDCERQSLPEVEHMFSETEWTSFMDSVLPVPLVKAEIQSVRPSSSSQSACDDDDMEIVYMSLAHRPSAKKKERWMCGYCFYKNRCSSRFCLVCRKNKH